MNMIKRALCVVFCVLLCVSCFAFSASAEKITKEGPTVSIIKLTAVPGDSVVIPVNMDQNPGVMAMTFTISYNPDVLEYVDYEKGVCSDYTVVDHPDRGYVSFVNCENNNKVFTGALLSLKFTVKEKAAPGFHEMKVRNIRPEKNGDSMQGCFADWNGNKFNPVIISGGITIGETCSNSAHLYNDWVTTVKPLCEIDGVKIRSCTRSGCGSTETAAVPMLGDHDYQDFWTIDQEATDSHSGIMSRHCKNCSEFTDRKSFTLNDSKENNFENKPQTNVKEEQWDRLELPKKENPTVSSTPSAPSTSSSEQTTSSSDATSSKETVSSEIEEDIPNAEAIVNDVKKEKDGFGVKAYRYLFGEGEEKGLFGRIFDAFPEWLQNLSPWWILVLVLVIVVVVVLI